MHALLAIEGVQVPIQVVSLPINPQAREALATGKTGVVRDNDVSLVREALGRKMFQQASGTLLLLDVTLAGVLASPDLVAAYLQKYPSPAQEFRWREVWLVGPTERLALPLA